MSADNSQTILGHLEELRWRLLKIAIAVLVGGIAALVFSGWLRDVLEQPFLSAVPGNDFQVLAPGEEFGVLMRISLFGGLVLSSPIVLYQIWAFINPALTSKERRWVVPIVLALVLLFVGGVLFAYWSLPRGLEFLLGIFPDVRTDLRLGYYYSFAIRYLLAFGIAFLYPVFLYAAAAARVITPAQLASGRPWAVVIVVTGAAIITPSGDAYTLAILSVPLYLMYEITYWLARLTIKPKTL